MFRNAGSQPLNLAAGCIADGGVYHEVMHSLGFDHEHNRYDRDNYLTIDLQNVDPSLFLFVFIFYTILLEKANIILNIS